MRWGIVPSACALLIGLTSAAAPGQVAPGAESPGSTATEPKASPARPLAPEFGPSVQFDKNDPPVALADLRGKAVLMVFFQSW